MITLNYPTKYDALVEMNVTEAQIRLKKVGGSLEELSNTLSERNGELWRSIELKEPELVKLSGYQYLGTRKYENGIASIFAIEQQDQLFKEEDDRCDLCHSKRERNVYHYFNHNGNVVCLGSSCAKKTFGIDFEKSLFKYWEVILGLREYVEKFHDPENEGIGTRGCGFDSYDFEEVVKTTIYEVRNNGWISKTKADLTGFLTTATSVEMILRDRELSKLKDKAMSLDIDMVEVEKKLIEEFWKETPENNFESNMINAIFISDDNQVLLRKQFSKLGMVVFAIHNVTTPKLNDRVSDHFVGVEGQRSDFKGMVEKLSTYQHDYGVGTVVVFRTLCGAEMLWFNTNGSGDWQTGEFVKFKATVKRHKTVSFKQTDKKVTMINRVKLIEILKEVS